MIATAISQCPGLARPRLVCFVGHVGDERRQTEPGPKRADAKDGEHDWPSADDAAQGLVDTTYVGFMPELLQDRK